ncbi:hypothetical protein ACHAXT_002020 [Thalassiosira profunda]
MCLPTERSKPAGSKPAATAAAGFSPRLVRARADHPPNRLAAWALVTLCTASFYLGPLLLLSPFLIYPFHPKAAGVLLCTSVFLAVHPVSPWPRFRRMCQLFYGVFDFHHNMTPKLDEIAARENRLSIVACHPHAIIPLHGFIWGAICDQLLPHMYGVGATTDGALYLPVLRHVLQYLSVGSTQKKAIVASMQQNGQNLFMLPGGVAEIFLSHRRPTADNALPHVQTIKARRYGLMKLALETGASVYPCFVFGASDMLDQLTPVDNNGSDDNKSKETKSGGGIGSTMMALSRKIGGGLTLYYGQYGLPIPWTPRLSMVMGDPVHPVLNGKTVANVSGDKRTCERVDNPTSAQVNELMERYVDATHRLFEQYKAMAGYPNDTLRII